MANWNLPTVTDLYTNIITYFKDRDLDLAKGLDPAAVTVTNPVTNMIRWASANNRWEKYNGTTWVVLSSAYEFTNLAYTGTLTGGAGIVNLGSGQFYKDASGNVGIGVTPGTKLQALGIIKSGGTGTNGEFNLARTSDGLSVGKITLTESTQILDYNNLLGSGVHTFTINAVERMRIDASGNVGIGTSSPTTRLDVRGGDITLSRSAAATAGDAALNFGNGATNYIYGGNTSNIMAFAVNSSERMRIDSSGNVGIGTSSPNTNLGADGTKLQLATYGGISTWLINTNLGYYSVGGVYNWRYPSGTVAGRSAAMIETGGTSGKSVIFYVAPPCTGAVDSVASPVTAMTILDAGNVGIGTTTPSYPLHVNGTGLVSSLIINGGGTYTAGSIYSDSSWGMLFRAKQASPSQADFAWTNSANVERMRIAADGSVIIGDTTARGQLTVAQNASTGTSSYLVNLNTASNVTKSSSLYFAGYDTASTYKPAAYITCVPNDVNYVGSYLSFGTRASDTVTEQMRIASDGTVTTTGNINAAAFGTSGVVYAKTGTASGATATQAFSMGTLASSINIHYGTNAPTHSSAQGSLYIRTDGSSTTTRLYINTNGTTGWTYLTAGA